MRGVKHYTKTGREYKGKTHKMPNGELHTGERHRSNSQRLFHKNELPKSVQAKIK